MTFTYTSVDENRFMRGIAASAAFKKFIISSFLSRKYIDARFNYSSSGNENISALVQTDITPSLLK